MSRAPKGSATAQPGIAFPALYALERDGLPRGETRLSDDNRRARYKITARGRKVLEQKEERWQRVTIVTVLRTA